MKPTRLVLQSPLKPDILVSLLVQKLSEQASLASWHPTSKFFSLCSD